MQEGGVGFFQSDFYCMIVDDFDIVQGCVFIVGFFVIVCDGIEEFGVWILGFWVDCVFQRIFYVCCCDFVVVVEFYFFVQYKGVDFVVFGNGVVFCQVVY